MDDIKEWEEINNKEEEDDESHKDIVSSGYIRYFYFVSTSSLD